MSTHNEIGLRIENLVAGAITAGLLILVAVLVGPVLALLGFFMVALIFSILIALGPKSNPQISESGPDAQSRTQFEYHTTNGSADEQVGRQQGHGLLTGR